MIRTHPAILVGDIGSTKSDWVLIEHAGAQTALKLPGYNPLLHEPRLLADILRELRESFPPPDEIYYYGSGVADNSSKVAIRSDLETSFPGVKCAVESDLLGAARALCGRSPGIVGILGTGSHCARYDGEELVVPLPSLGYPLGDEGGGWRIGAELVRSYYYNRMPADLRVAFGQLLTADLHDLIKEVRNSASPNTYLAAFAKFAVTHRNDDWIRALVANEIIHFIESKLVPLKPARQIDFAGSIAVHFRATLSECLNEHSMLLGTTMQSPVSGLVEYHHARIAGTG